VHTREISLVPPGYFSTVVLSGARADRLPGPASRRISRQLCKLSSRAPIEIWHRQRRGIERQFKASEQWLWPIRGFSCPFYPFYAYNKEYHYQFAALSLVHLDVS